jgi:hypothetical protein
MTPHASGCAAASSRAASASSGVLTLKNGSTGVSGQSAMAMPWRPVLVDQRAAQVGAERDRPKAHHRMAPFAGSGTGERLRAGLACRMKAGDEIARQERAVAWHGDDPGEIGMIGGGPVESGQHAGKRTGMTRHIVGDDGQAGGGEAGRVPVGIEGKSRALRCEAREHAIENRGAADLDQQLVAAARRERGRALQGQDCSSAGNRDEKRRRRGMEETFSRHASPPCAGASRSPPRHS